MKHESCTFEINWTKVYWVERGGGGVGTRGFKVSIELAVADDAMIRNGLKPGTPASRQCLLTLLELRHARMIVNDLAK